MITGKLISVGNPLKTHLAVTIIIKYNIKNNEKFHRDL